MSESSLRRLMYRWLVEFNPLYLLSAALVLAGANLLSRGLAQGGVLEQLGVGAIAELYALALIAGAALLTRIGLRRPAVMLALLTALYQGDLTLHTETCAYLGWAGAFGSAAWVALFAIKLVLLEWALKIQISRAAKAVATLGALGVALFPPNLVHLDARHGTALVALWAFALAAIGLHVPHGVTSRVDLDGWGRTVLRRTTRAIWAMWAALALFHVGFWSLQYGLDLTVLLPALLLLSTRWMRSEVRVWVTITATLGFVGVEWPALFSPTAFMATGALLLRASFPFARQSYVPAPAVVAGPYRVAAEVHPASATLRAFPLMRAECLRALVGALGTAYLATWTLRWTGGAWPAHLVGLDLAMTALLLFAAARERSWPMALPLAATYAHLAVQIGLISAPRSVLQWGGASVGLGFGLLTASLAASVRLRRSGAEGSDGDAGVIGRAA